MNIVTVGFGLVLSYPIYTYFVPTYLAGAAERYNWLLHYQHPMWAEVTGVSFMPNVLFVIACVGLGLIAAEIFFSIYYVLLIYGRACVRTIRILASRKTQETKS